MPVVDRRMSMATISWSLGQRTRSMTCGTGQRRSGFTPEVTSTRGGRSAAGRTGIQPRGGPRESTRAGRAAAWHRLPPGPAPRRARRARTRRDAKASTSGACARPPQSLAPWRAAAVCRPAAPGAAPTRAARRAARPRLRTGSMRRSVHRSRSDHVGPATPTRESAPAARGLRGTTCTTPRSHRSASAVSWRADPPVALRLRPDPVTCATYSGVYSATRSRSRSITGTDRDRPWFSPRNFPGEAGRDLAERQRVAPLPRGAGRLERFPGAQIGDVEDVVAAPAARRRIAAETGRCRHAPETADRSARVRMPRRRHCARAARAPSPTPAPRPFPGADSPIVTHG